LYGVKEWLEAAPVNYFTLRSNNLSDQLCFAKVGRAIKFVFLCEFPTAYILSS